MNKCENCGKTSHNGVYCLHCAHPGHVSKKGRRKTVEGPEKGGAHKRVQRTISLWLHDEGGVLGGVAFAGGRTMTVGGKQ